MKLTNEQQKAIDNSLPELLQGKEYLLTGAAGVGKSFSAVQIIHSLPPNWRFVLTAPTNKATKVVEAFAHKAGIADRATICTTHSFLQLKPYINQETGVRSFVPGKGKHNNIIQNTKNTLLVCDEAGCLEEALIYYLFDKDMPKLFLADKFQLGPVGERDGYIFELMEDSQTELTKVIRYSGHLLEAATDIRSNIYKRNLTYRQDNDGDEGIFKVSRRYLEKTIIDLVKTDEFEESSDYLKVGTWRNITMDYWNAYIRRILFPEKFDTQRWFEGLRIVALEPCNEMERIETKRSEYWKANKLLSASMEASIQYVTVGRADYGQYFSSVHGGYPPAFKCYFLDVLTELGKEVTLRVIHEDDEQKLDDYLKNLINLRSWKLYYDVKDYFHSVGDAYSMTVRRMQGSTYKYLVMDKSDVDTCKVSYDRNRILYVLMTRAKQRVYL